MLSEFSNYFDDNEIFRISHPDWLEYQNEFHCPFLNLKAGLSPFKKNWFICFSESPLKTMENAFYFGLKALFVLKIFKFCLEFLVM